MREGVYVYETFKIQHWSRNPAAATWREWIPSQYIFSLLIKNPKGLEWITLYVSSWHSPELEFISTHHKWFIIVHTKRFNWLVFNDFVQSLVCLRLKQMKINFNICISCNNGKIKWVKEFKNKFCCVVMDFAFIYSLEHCCIKIHCWSASQPCEIKYNLRALLKSHSFLNCTKH